MWQFSDFRIYTGIEVFQCFSYGGTQKGHLGNRVLPQTKEALP
jgi:hypothetical protein